MNAGSARSFRAPRLAALVLAVAAASCARAGDDAAAAPPAAVSQPAPSPTRAPPVPPTVLVRAGTFTMGSADGPENERPPHRVTLTRDVLFATFMVSFDDWDLYCDATGRPRLPSRGDERGTVPVIHVDWFDAVAYCNWLSLAHGLTPCYSGGGNAIRCDRDADGWRLPTEAEWEWAARGGSAGQGHAWAGGDDPREVAWFSGNSGGRMHPAGELAPNELGIYDMSGNLYEWCWDFYAKDAYAAGDATDPAGPTDWGMPSPRGPERVRRGGSWREDAEAARVAFRAFDNAHYPGDNGFRVVRTASPP